MKKLLLIFLLTTLAATGHSQKVRIIENSTLAKMIAKMKGQKPYAITFGKTIFVSCKKEEFLSTPWWVKHELRHVQQYANEGVFRFISLYLFYSVFHHNSENPFEKDAEDAEYANK